MNLIEVLETPDKSENDKKSYRVIRLENGLTALLISDPYRNSMEKEQITDKHSRKRKWEDTKDANDVQKIETNGGNDVKPYFEGKTYEDAINDAHQEEPEKLSACSICVDVGSFSDPRNVQGLAHFLEHMISVWSEHPSDYDGSHTIDANTTLNETSFFFQTQLKYLYDSLSQFSKFFKSPLMLKDAMTLEREAVDSEFALQKNDEEERRNQLLSMLGQSSHPSSLFPCGNLKTLKENIEDDILYQKVHDFRKRHYSAHRMYLCIQSSLPLGILEKMVQRHFSSLPNNELPSDDFSQYTHNNAFQPKFYEKAYFVKAIQNISRIDITWCLPSMIQNFRCKPDKYLIYILNCKGEGSLFYYLRKRLWALKLTTESTEMGNLFSLFNIRVHLTEDGFYHIDEILSAVFNYLKFLQLVSPSQSIYRDIQANVANDFRFSDKQNPLENVKDLVHCLKQYPSKFILTGDRLFFEFDANIIQQVIDELNSRKFNIMITSTRRYNENVNYELIEPLFGTKYSELDMPVKWISLWKNATPLPEFTLPGPNSFIADDFTMLYEHGRIIAKYPTKIFDNEICELWFRQDDKFQLPRACYNFYFMTPLAISSIENMVSTSLLARILKHQFAEKISSYVTGFTFSCCVGDLGIVLEFEGFNQKLHLLVDMFIKCLKSVTEDLTENEFKIFVQRQFQKFQNMCLRSNELATDLQLNILESHHQPFYQKYQCLRSINFIGFQQFCQSYCDQMKIKALMQGNITKEHSLNIMHNILNELNCGKVEDFSSIQLRTTKLPIGANYLRCKAFDPNDVNTVIINYYQVGPMSYHTRILSELLLLIADQSAFNTLRSKEQLAYHVSTALHQNFGVLGYSISINSQESKFTVDYVEERIENYRRELTTTIEKIPDEYFEAHKAVLTTHKIKEDVDLRSEVDRNWTEIITDGYQFDRRNKEMKYLSTITKQQLLDFYQANYGEAERKLSVQIIGNDQENDMNFVTNGDFEVDEHLEGRRKRFDSLAYVEFNGTPKGNLIKDSAEFKNILEVYPVSKTNQFLV